MAQDPKLVLLSGFARIAQDRPPVIVTSGLSVFSGIDEVIELPDNGLFVIETQADLEEAEARLIRRIREAHQRLAARDRIWRLAQAPRPKGSRKQRRLARTRRLQRARKLLRMILLP